MSGDLWCGEARRYLKCLTEVSIFVRHCVKKSAKQKRVQFIAKSIQYYPSDFADIYGHGIYGINVTNLYIY